ncbi:hypothetical protein [Streptomyces roseoverticillatus]|uniref:DNA polymerase III subunit beta family protein n=1 Tax=Streptomyces roseoverticillatus TaxID=66429 RepID=UPI0004C148A5|nr:hypothetical protein [Streptomyces roseoverticillatus]
MVIGPIGDFPYLLEQVSDHMYPDDSFAVLNGIYFEADRHYLYAVATDRHTLAATRRKLATGAATGWSRFVPASALKSVRAFVRLNRRSPVHVGTASPNGFALATEDQRLEVPVYEGELPEVWRGQWRSTLAQAIAAGPALRQELQLSPVLLARWGKAGRAERHMPLTVWSSGPNRPLVIACGEDFLGAQMPLRYQGNPRLRVLSSWVESLEAIEARRAA